VGSVTFLDSSITNTKIGVITAHTSSSSPPTGGSLILENIVLSNVGIAVQGISGNTLLAGGSTTIAGWGQGNEYTPSGPTAFSGSITPFSRPSSLVVGGKYYARSKPQYNTLPLSSFASVRTAGAKGDGKTDDTAAINSVLKSAAAAGQVVFFDAGTYKVTSTINVPPGSRLVGETYSVIMGSGSFFSSMSNPQPVVQVGIAGQTGVVEWSDMIVSTQGATAGAILIQWNLASPAGSPSGLWDVHTRIGGFTGSSLSLSNCPKTPTSTIINTNCIAAFLSLYLAPSSSGVYLENNWLWTADHDIDDPNVTQITIYTGRGLYSASTTGTIWLVGTAVEHHALYQYQFANTQNVYAGQIQTETAYYQPNPPATEPFASNPTWNDFDFVAGCYGAAANCQMGWGLRVVTSSNILVYGAGLYSFFSNYNVSTYTLFLFPPSLLPPPSSLSSKLTRKSLLQRGQRRELPSQNLQHQRHEHEYRCL
jgi:glucan 1,3-beta-glucosidase